jgi:hypothetical protein
MLVILGKVGAGGAKVEAIFRQGLEHPVAGVRKESLPGVARLLRGIAADLAAGLSWGRGLRAADSPPAS